MGKPLVKKKKKKGEEEEALRSPYRRLGQPGAYSGSEAFLKALNVKRAHSKDGVRRVLQGEPSYTLHRPVRRKFPRRKTIVSGPFDQCQCDLVDVSAYKKENDGVRFLLCAVDVFSKYAWVTALKGKTGKEVSQAFEDILHEASHDPLHVQTDKGKEFRTSAFEGVAKRRGIEVFSSENDYIKASPVERFQRTLQNIMHRHFTSSRIRSFLKVLQEMVRTYNTTYHRAIGMAPAQVRPKDYEAFWQRLYGTGVPCQSPKLKAGDHFRIRETRRTFKKGYLPHWSLEIFLIDGVLPTSPPTYTVVDFGGRSCRDHFMNKSCRWYSPRPIKMLNLSWRRALVRDARNISSNGPVTRTLSIPGKLISSGPPKCVPSLGQVWVFTVTALTPSVTVVINVTTFLFNGIKINLYSPLYDFLLPHPNTPILRICITKNKTKQNWCIVEYFNAWSDSRDGLTMTDTLVYMFFSFIIPAWISNNLTVKLWYVITYPSSKSNACPEKFGDG